MMTTTQCLDEMAEVTEEDYERIKTMITDDKPAVCISMEDFNKMGLPLRYRIPEGVLVTTDDGHEIKTLESESTALRVEKYLAYFQRIAGVPNDVMPKSLVIRQTTSRDVYPDGEFFFRRTEPVEGIYIEVDGKEISIEELDQEIREANAKRLKNNDTTN